MTASLKAASHIMTGFEGLFHHPHSIHKILFSGWVFIELRWEEPLGGAAVRASGASEA